MIELNDRRYQPTHFWQNSQVDQEVDSTIFVGRFCNCPVLDKHQTFNELMLCDALASRQ